MGTEIKTKALVLHEMPIGDYDKRLVLLTKESGKMIAFAKGARKPNSKFLAGCQIFSYGDYTLYHGKQSYNLNDVELIDSFHNIRKEIERFAYGLYILEFLEFVSEENEPNHDLMKLGIRVLKIMEKSKESEELIVNIFSLKAMSYIGYSPWVSSCMSCGKQEHLTRFSVTAGGVLCNECKPEDANFINIQEATRYTLQYILENPIQLIFKFQIENEISNEFFLVMHRFIDYNLNKKFRSLEFLKFSE